MTARFSHIDAVAAREKLDADAATFVDIRDAESRRAGSITASVHLTAETVDTFVSAADRTRPIIVYCYHGNSSQMAAQYLVERGFAEVYSMDGGYEAWAQAHPASD